MGVILKVQARPLCMTAVGGIEGAETAWDQAFRDRPHRDVSRVVPNLVVVHRGGGVAALRIATAVTQHEVLLARVIGAHEGSVVVLKFGGRQKIAGGESC